MTQEERRLYLIDYLVRERGEFSLSGVPEGEQAQRDLLRALMNVRMPDPIPEEVLQVQDDYLKEENARAGVVTLHDLTPIPDDERLYLWQGDLTRLAVDAIVNPANSAMLGCFIPLHGCADNVIGSKAGIGLRLYCHEIMCAQGHEEPCGKAKITPGFNLPARHVIHTVGPYVEGELTPEHERLLASCYRSCLELASERQLTSVAFCCISCGVFRFPHERAAEIAIRTVRDFLDGCEGAPKVVFCVYEDVDRTIYERLLGAPADI